MVFPYSVKPIMSLLETLSEKSDLTVSPDFFTVLKAIKLRFKLGKYCCVALRIGVTHKLRCF